VRWYDISLSTIDYEVVDVWDTDFDEIDNILQNIDDELEVMLG
jgi:hypothetical protein